METVPSRSSAAAERSRVAAGGGCDGCILCGLSPSREDHLGPLNDYLNFCWVLSLLIFRVNANFPEKRGSQDARAIRSRRQGRELAHKLLAGWLSSLLWNITVGVASIVLKYPGSQEHLRTLFSMPALGALATNPQVACIPAFKICTISSSTQQRNRAANKAHEHRKCYRTFATWVQVSPGSALFAFSIYPELAWFIFMMALLTGKPLKLWF